VLRVTSFGPDEDIPENRVMSISQSLSDNEIEIVINIVRELCLDGYNFFDSRGEDVREDILIGSYGNPEYEVLAIRT
jgi:hypothetical protein